MKPRLRHEPSARARCSNLTNILNIHSCDADSLCMRILDNGSVTGEAVKSVHQLSRNKHKYHFGVETRRDRRVDCRVDTYFLNAAASSLSSPS